MPSREVKLTNLLQQLKEIEDFSIEHAVKVCESSSRFVRSTVNKLVTDKLLKAYENEGTARFEWLAKPSQEVVSSWIRRQIRGSQITQTPLHERPRERLQIDGTSPLSNADLLAILIRVGIQGESAVQAGVKLGNYFANSLPQLRKMTLLELREITKAVNRASFAQIMAGIELGRRLAHAEMTQPEEIVKITGSASAVQYCCDTFRFLAEDGVQEEFHIVTLDTKLKPIRTHRITVGTLDASLVHPREVFRPAIRDACSAIILVHNHPSGDPTPSREDRQVTERLTESGKLLGINVLDHIIVTRNGGLSLAEIA